MNHLINHKTSVPAWQLAKMKTILRDRWKEVWEIVLTRESGSLAKNLWGRQASYKVDWTRETALIPLR